MSALPTSLYKCAQVQALDKAVIASQSTTGFELMQLAGKRAFELLQSRWPQASTLTVFCGGGNNGGDGYVVAALALQAGLQVQVYTLADVRKLDNEASLAYAAAVKAGMEVKAYTPNISQLKGVVVDALLGVGVSGQVRQDYAAAILGINSTALPVLAIDVPSGICGDTGKIQGVAIRATTTLSFIGLKQGLLTCDATECVGELVYDSLDIHPSIFETQTPSCNRLEFQPPLLAARHKNSHKGMFGRLLVVAGDEGFGGAGIMAAEAALITGAGLVSLATRQQHVSAALARRPELMVRGVESGSDLEALLASSDILIVGPGIGQSEWSTAMLSLCLEAKKPMLIDADGLNLLASTFAAHAPRENWVLTPHPAEAARLLNISTAQVQANRFGAATQLQAKYGGVIVLKGAGTIIAGKQAIAGKQGIADQQGLSLCSAGNPAMSTPGMGDVLSGIIGALLASDMSISDAARKGVWAHATAGDLSANKLGKHLLATEIYPELRALL